MHLPESVVLGSRSQSHVGVSDYGDWTRLVRAADQVFFTRSFQSITGSARFVLISDYFRDLNGFDKATSQNKSTSPGHDQMTAGSLSGHSRFGCRSPQF